MPLDEYEWINK
jgi:cyclic pyranopterin phosphate synthase